MAVFLLLAFALLVLWLRYWALPHVDSYRGPIVASIERASGLAIEVRAMHGGWEGLRPTLSLEGLELADAHGHEALALQHAEVTLSWWALLRGRVRFHDVAFYGPVLSLRRGADGLVYLADRPLDAPGGSADAAFAEWLLAQPRLDVRDAVLVWRDELAGAPEVRLTDVQIAVRRRGGRHQAALDARPPPALAGRIEVRADVALRRAGSGWDASGQLFAEALDTDLGRLRRHLPVPESLRSGLGSLRVWASFARGAVSDVVADITVRDATAQLAADALPLELASLSGRARYAARPDGFTFATEGLRFRLAGGPEAHPGDFSMQRRAGPGEAPRFEVRADGIDLKIAATLIDYFPVPRDIKSQARRFAPRGALKDAAFTWTGEDTAHARAFAIRGRFVDLAVNAVDGWPGVAGLSGSIAGTEASGTVALDARNASLQLPGVFRTPLAFDRVMADATWKRRDGALVVDVADARFANADAEGRFAGSWRALPDSPHKSPGYLDVKGSLSRADARHAIAYVPERFGVARRWLEAALRAGTSRRVQFAVRGDLWDFPFGPGSDGRFVVEGDIRNGRLKYHPDWPAVDDVQGTFRFENRRLEIRADEAAIFDSRARSVAAVIEGLGSAAPLLTVDGVIDTTGADSLRFLRESPLVRGPGAFSRAIAIEGPGKLQIHLAYPLGGSAPVQVAGDYEFAGATASVSPRLAMRDVRGRLSFTEKGVSAPDIRGVLFGEPARLAMATRADGLVETRIEGRAEAAALAPYLPAPLLAHLEGVAPWQAVVVSNAGGSDLHVTSDLRGLAVTLPRPLAKAKDEARTLTVDVARVDADAPQVRFRLAGGIDGRYGAMADGGWHAAVRFGGRLAAEPPHPGLWLYGSLPDLDIDAWQALLAAPPEAAAAGGAAAAPAAEPVLRGLDLTLARVRYLGRDFAQMHATLERSGGRWQGRLESPKVAGDVVWDPAGRGRLEARLARLALPRPAQPQPAGTDEPEGALGELPALDVEAERFEFAGRWLGKLHLRAAPAGEEWRIERLDIVNDHAQFRSHGGWRRTGAGSITTLEVKLGAGNLNALLGQFGYGAYLKRGDGSLEGSLVWPGYPYDFRLAALAGSFKVQAHRGQFAKIEPGAGKLLGLLSLQTLPRRAALDFRDVFSEGFAFERMQGDVKIARGVLLTDDFEISGPSAFVSLAGEVSLPEETQSLTMRVVPEVSEGLALAATLIGTPVLGLSTLLVSKLLRNPLGKVVAYEYRITGSWDNPQVARVNTPSRASASSP